jgi:hypothetical protein
MRYDRAQTSLDRHAIYIVARVHRLSRTLARPQVRQSSPAAHAARLPTAPE